MHVDAICKKTSKLLYALRLLKRNALPVSVLFNVYCTCFRPILEYSCEAWYNNLLAYLSIQIESVQKRAFRIIYPTFTYCQAMHTVKVRSLHYRRGILCECLFHRELDPEHKSNSLHPPLRPNEHNLRHHLSFKVPVCRIDRNYKSFIQSVATLYDTKWF